jgi:hypothetical protein
MTTTTSPAPDSTAAPEADAAFIKMFDALTISARVEVDRYCEGCGYNMHTQAVKIDPRTGVPICRCPECGRFHAAGDSSTIGRVWLHRAARVALLTWLVVAWGSALAFVIAEAVVMLTWREMALRAIMGASLRTDEFIAQIAIPITLSALIGLITSSFCAVGFAHWKWWSYVIAAFIWPVMAMLIVWLVMISSRGQLFYASFGYLSALIGAHLVGGLIGIVVGRPMARLMVMTLLPPSVWPILAYIWTVDGKLVPKGRVKFA